MLNKWICTNVQRSKRPTITALKYKAHFGNRIRGLLNKLFKKEKTESLRKDVQEKLSEKRFMNLVKKDA